MNPRLLVAGPPPEWAAYSKVFVALGDPHRQRILLAFEPGDELSIQSIVQHMPLSRTAVVHHLAVLRDAGLLHSDTCGRETRYRINPGPLHEALAAVQDYLTRFPSPAAKSATSFPATE